MNIYISHAGKYDYINKIYNPIKKSDLIKSNTFFFPHEDENQRIKTEDVISYMDLVIAEVSLPTTGQGIELGLAYCAKVPILCIYEKDKKISSSLKYITNEFIEYGNIEEMINNISEFINMHKL